MSAVKMHYSLAFLVSSKSVLPKTGPNSKCDTPEEEEK
jgi:hypothetical protein